MTIIVFLLDTSSSMNQRVFLGGRPTLLDVAKSAVETFVKVRQRSLDSRGDRYMLLTFEEPPANIKAGWKENLGTFMTELKNLQANGLTTLGSALRHTFDVLNVNRMQHGIDTYGQGRCPFYLEPSIIVAITDGGQLSSNSGVQDDLKMLGSSPGHELTREPFRWDQRLFSLVLRMSGQPIGDRETGLVPSDSSPIDHMCELTGGRSYSITSHRMLHQCIDSLVQKVQAGVVLNFEKFGNDPPSILNSEGVKVDDDFGMDDKNGSNKHGWQNSRKMIYVPRSNQKGGFAGGFWPIPESFWPDPNLTSLPPRLAHPNVKFICQDHEPMVVENLPFDKYELEPSPLTQYVLARKQPNVCWQVFIPNSSRNMSVPQPFGYLKASTNLSCVNLFVMPFNYPILLPLLDDLFRVYKVKPPNEWKALFGMYMASMPPYYSGPLKRALVRMNAGNIASSIMEENYLSFSVLNYLKKIKTQSKSEFDRTCNEVVSRVKINEPARTIRAITSYKNPFDVPRHMLLDHMAKLRALFLRPSNTTIAQQEALHSMPVSQMGNYQEYLKRMPTPLREIESTPVRQHMFGNPFKLDKRMMIDEADIDLIGGGTSSKALKSKDTNNSNTNSQQIQNQSTSPSSPPASPNHTTQINSNNPVSTSTQIKFPTKRKQGPLSKDYHFVPKKNSPSLSPAYYPSFNSPIPSPSFLSPIKSPFQELRLSPPPSPTTTTTATITPPPPDITSIPPISSLETLKLPKVNLFTPIVPPSSEEDDKDSEEDLMMDEDDDDDDEDGDGDDVEILNENSNLMDIQENIVNSSSVNNLNSLVEANERESALSINYNHMNGEADDAQQRLLNNNTNNNSNNFSNDVENTDPLLSSSVAAALLRNPPPSFNRKRDTNNKKDKNKEEDIIEIFTPPLPPPPPPTQDIDIIIDDEGAQRQNIQIRIEIFKEIRRPQLRMHSFLTNILSLKGSRETKLRFIKSIKKEAERFKKSSLVKVIDEQTQRILTSSSINS